MGFHYYPLYKLGNVIIYTSSKNIMSLCNQLGAKYLFSVAGEKIGFSNFNMKTRQKVDLYIVPGRDYKRTLKELLQVKKTKDKDLPLLMGRLKEKNAVTVLEKRLRRS